MDRQKSEMVAALWSNSNYDDTEENKGTRQNAIDHIENSYEESLEMLERLIAGEGQEEDDDLDKDNPFFQAAARGMDKLEKQVGHLVKPDVDEEFNYMKGLDQED